MIPLADCSFSLDVDNEHTDYSSVGQNYDGIFTGPVNSVWSRDSGSSRMLASDYLSTSKETPSHGLLSERANFQNMSIPEDTRPSKRLLPSEEYPLTSKQTHAPLPLKRRVETPATCQLPPSSKEEEDTMLEEGLNKYGVPSWVQVAKHVKSQLVSSSEGHQLASKQIHGPLPAKQPHTSLPSKQRRTATPAKRPLSKWSQEEDTRLQEGVNKYGVPNWILVAKHVKTRNNKMCAQRWRNSLRPGIKVLKKGKWSAEEDDQLREMVSKYDCQDGHTWELVSEGMGFTRNVKQCSERWENFLDPSLRLGPWTAEEDACLLRLHSEFGNAWKQFASILKGRSAERIRRHFSQLNKKILKARSAERIRRHFSQLNKKVK